MTHINNSWLGCLVFGAKSTAPCCGGGLRVSLHPGPGVFQLHRVPVPLYHSPIRQSHCITAPLASPTVSQPHSPVPPYHSPIRQFHRITAPFATTTGLAVPNPVVSQLHTEPVPLYHSPIRLSHCVPVTQSAGPTVFQLH